MTDSVLDSPTVSPLVSAYGAMDYLGLPIVFQIIHIGREWSFPTAQAAERFASGWHPTDRPQARAIPRGGDGRPVLTSATATIFVSKCTSTRWVDDRDEHLRNGELVLAALAGDKAPQPFQGVATEGFVTDPQVVDTQRVWLGALPGADALGGFRVECSNPVRAHEGQCGFAKWDWDWRARTVNT